jgi:cytochrome b561
MNQNDTPPPAYYPRAMQLLHWTIGLLISTALTCGLLLSVEIVSGRTPLGKTLMSLHVGCAIASLFLWLVRVFVRSRSNVPEVLGPTNEKRIANTGHVALYILTLAMPISGYAMDLAYRSAPSSFGITFPAFGFPTSGESNEAIGEVLWNFHSYGGKALALLVVVHILAALWRSWGATGDGVARMLPPKK